MTKSLDGGFLMRRHWSKYNLIVFCGAAVLMCSTPCSAGRLSQVSYLYRLSTFTGMAPVGMWPRVRVDRKNNEVYVVSQDEIRIFNRTGMEIYQFNNMLDDTAQVQTIQDVAVKEDGNMIFLTQIYRNGTFDSELVLGNYRGDPVSRFTLKHLPPQLSDFQPNRILYQDGLLFLANTNEKQIITVDQQGSFRRYFDIGALLRSHVEKEKESGGRSKRWGRDDTDQDMGDFSLDREGNILFTIPAAGDVYKLTPDLQLVSIGRGRGSSPDRFGIPVAIIADNEGNYLISDILQSVVKVFDKDLHFIGSFGGRHRGGDALFSPRELAIDAENRLYVSQTERAGVSVFQLIND